MHFAFLQTYTPPPLPQPYPVQVQQQLSIKPPRDDNMKSAYGHAMCTGWGDMGYNNGTAATPNLDAWSVADSAIKFERFYAGSPICCESPVRLRGSLS